ncbi:hypothetical protein BC629DRAFT_1480171 [Irpex lacteus]|nr:hypothetical protein BC629DRAFT_1480171 [Irpex lacteus]
MSSTIAITTSHTHHLGCNHAYIGGFAWALLGSSRPTEITNIFNLSVGLYDIDILIQLGEGQDIMVIRRRLEEANAHFATAGFKLFFVQSPDPRFRNAELVRRNRDNVLIETLKAGTLGLPKLAGPVYEVSEEGIRILHPTILILTKFNRWYHTHQSTRPKTRSKVRTDTRDITFMLDYLADKSWKIEFEKYTGNPKEKLLRMVAIFHGKLVEDEEDEVVQTLQEVMYPGDWEAMRALPSVMEAESTMPPADDGFTQHDDLRQAAGLNSNGGLGQNSGLNQKRALDHQVVFLGTPVQGAVAPLENGTFTQHDDIGQAAGLNSNGGLGQNSGLSQERALDHQVVFFGTPVQGAVVPLDTSNQSEDIPHDTSATAASLAVGGDIIAHSEGSVQQQQRSIEEGLLSQGEIVNGPLDTSNQSRDIPHDSSSATVLVGGDIITHSEDSVQQQQSLARTKEREKDSSCSSRSHIETVGDHGDSDEEIQGWIVLS